MDNLEIDFSQKWFSRQDISRLWSSLTQKSDSTLGDKFEVMSVEVSKLHLLRKKLSKKWCWQWPQIESWLFHAKITQNKTHNRTRHHVLEQNYCIVLQQHDFVFIEQLVSVGRIQQPKVWFKRDLPEKQKANCPQQKERNRVVFFFS